MILGLDHLALSVIDLDEALASLPGERVFEAKGLPNPPEKSPLLAGFAPTHDLALVRPPTGPALELTRHGPALAASRGPYGILEDGRVALSCPDPAGEREFWLRGMSFGPGRSGRSARLARPVAAWCCELEFLEGPGGSPSLLDSEGLVCAAFLVSSLEADLSSALAAGATRQTGTFRLVVNGKPLAIAFFRTPSGALVELVQMERIAP